MSEVSEYLERGAKRAGFHREFYVEKNIPTLHSNIVVLPFFGDMRATCILSSFILKEFKKTLDGKYLVLCSWPGYQHLFPYVDEYWTIQDSSVIKSLAIKADNFYNYSDLSVQIKKSLIEIFDIITYEDIKPFYENGFGVKYRSEIGDPVRFLPQVPSSVKIGDQLKSEMSRKLGKKLVLYPTMKMRAWQNGKNHNIQVSDEFWIHLCERLLDRGIVPVIYQNHATHDLSRHFADRCIYVVTNNVSELMAAISYVGCALDVFNGFSRLAMIARTPFICVDERARYVAQKDYEIDDLCCEIPKEYIFAFSTMLLSGSTKDWDSSFIDNILVRLESFMPQIEGKSDWLSLNEQYDPVSYERVREHKSKRMGVTFIRSKYK